jgi:hypothetical protein
MGHGELPMNADEYRRRAGRCLLVARQTANPEERARTVDTAMMWMELAEWAEGSGRRASSSKSRLRNW